MLRKITLLIVVALVTLSLCIKFVKFSDPYFGPHLFRQLQTVSTIDAYLKDGVDLLKPRTNYAGYPGHLIYEFPIYQATVTIISKYVGHPLETSRALNIFLSILSALLIYRIALLWFTRDVAIYSVLFFVFSPLNLMFHRSSMVDIMAVFFVLCSQWLMMKLFVENNWKNVFWFTVCGALAVLIKPLFLFPIVVIFFISFYENKSLRNLSGFWLAVKKFLGILVGFVSMLIVLVIWLKLSRNPEADYGMMGHLDWRALVDLKFYLNLLVRFVNQFLNPITVFLFALGAIVVWKGSFPKGQKSLLWIPIGYYLCFSSINLPHAYYSLILIPYFAILAGVGASVIESMMVKQGFLNTKYPTRVLIAILSSIVSVFLFLSNFTSAAILPNTRYHQIESEILPKIEPMQYSVVYINRQAQFPLSERLANQPFLYLKSFFKDLSRRDLEFHGNDDPLPRAVVLYALKQYGLMSYIQPGEDIKLEDKKIQFQGHLKYVFFYLFDNQSVIDEQMNHYQPIYQSSDWLIYDVSQN